MSDIFARFSLYLVESSTHSSATTHPLLEAIETIDRDDFIYQDLQDGKQPINGSRTFFFVNRHADKTNWFLTEGKPFPLQAKVVSFYSFKGGLGRTTALVLAAIQLARQGKRVALIDFDLEAPGLASLFSLESTELLSRRGVVDYMLDLMTNQYDDQAISLDDYYFSVESPNLTGSQGGQLYVFPATAIVDESDKHLNYIDKLSKLNLQYGPFEQRYAPDTLIQQVDSKLNPDVILIDTRTGVNDIGGLVFNRYADLAFLFFFGNEQNMFGLETVVAKLPKKLPVILVNSPVPVDAEADEQQAFLDKSYAIFSQYVYEQTALPDLYDEDATHFPIHVPYSPNAAWLSSTAKINALLSEGGTQNPYREIADIITGYLPTTGSQETNSTSPPQNVKSHIVNAFQRIVPDSTPTGEGDFIIEADLKSRFYARKDYRFIFDPKQFLILGDKGAGKTALYTMLQYPAYAKALARYCGTSVVEHAQWVKGLDRTGEDFPSQTAITLLTGESFTQTHRRNYWLLLLARVLNVADPAISRADFGELAELVKDQDLAVTAENVLGAHNQLLKTDGQTITVVYDYLDTVLPLDATGRGQLVAALLDLWYDYKDRFSQIKAKVFLRQDIFDREAAQWLNDKGKYNNFSQSLRWSPESLFNLVWKRVMGAEEALRGNFFENYTSRSTLAEEPGLGVVPNLEQGASEQVMKALFGETMGGKKKARPYQWVTNHIADTEGLIHPRSMLLLFKAAANRQMTDRAENRYPFRPVNLEQSIPDVSNARVSDLRNEYAGEMAKLLDELANHVPNWPVKETDLREAIRSILNTPTPDATIAQLKEMRVIKDYGKAKKQEEARYHIPDLYLSGLRLTRRGPK